MSFHEVRLPARLAFGSTGGVERRTEIVTLGSGYERRSTPWAQGRRRYLIGANLRSLDDMAALTWFFEARRGRLFGFRFRDFADFKSCAPGAVVSAGDQALGTGDGARTGFDLIKRYGEGVDALERRVRKPVAGTVRVAVAGVELDVGGFAVDAGLGLVAAERGGRVAVLGAGAPDLTLAEEAMALPDEGSSVRADRLLEARPGAARVRFIDGNADYQTGAVVVRSGGETGGVDLDLPAVCTATTARAAADRVLAGADGRSLTVALGPLEMLKLEPGDRVEIEGRAGVCRVVRLDQDETPSIVLEPVVDVAAGEEDVTPGPGEPGSVVGAPFVRVLDLPPLPGAEDDGRALAVVAADPWRAMQVFAGVSHDALTARGEARSSATVGVLVEALAPGQPWRWDEIGQARVRLEGRDPESRSNGALLAGSNALAVETEAGWEIVQYRAATPEGDGVWQLTGLLRGQQGTEGAMAAGASTGAICVVLDDALVRVASSRGERGSPLIWRAGPLGGPAGGAGVSEVTQTLTGLQERPWRPVHLAVVPDAGGRQVRWRARSRIDGDRWDGEASGADPLRFQLRVLQGEAVRREVVVEGEGWTYAAGDLATDFPGGIGEDAVIAVAQWGEGYGWGDEARARLS